MRKHIILFLGLILFSSVCFGEEKGLNEQNGYDWEQYNLLQKTGYASGFINGTTKAHEVLHWYVYTSALQNEKNPIKTEELLPVWNLTVGQITEGLDEFYKDYENKQILIKDAIYIICKEAKGESSEKIEREKQILRMPPEKQVIERSKDSIKEEVKKGTYSNVELKDGAVIDKRSQKEISLETQEDMDNFWKIVITPHKGSVIPKQQLNASQYLSGFALFLIGCFVFFIFSKAKKK
jgi:hypothetical protein